MSTTAPKPTTTTSSRPAGFVRTRFKRLTVPWEPDPVDAVMWTNLDTRTCVLEYEDAEGNTRRMQGQTAT